MSKKKEDQDLRDFGDSIKNFKVHPKVKDFFYMGKKWIIKQDQLEELMKTCEKDKPLSFLLAENKKDGKHYKFKIVCEKLK